MNIKTQKKIYKALYLVNFLIIIAAWWTTSGSAIPQLGLGYAINRIGALLGLLGGSFLLFQFLLISRASWLEEVFGHDKLTRFHRVNGLIGFFLIIFHPFFIVLGNSILSNISFQEQFAITSSRLYVWPAIIALGILIAIVISSIVIVRKKLKYETWFFVHLLNYVFLSMAVGHQFAIGSELQNGMWLRWYWAGLYSFVIFHLIYFRFIKPVLISKGNRLTVDKVESKSNVTHIYIKGELKNLDWKAGQFAYWRFITKKHIKEQHPFTISIEPNNKHLRISAKTVGDYTERMNQINVGAKVLFDGPHGVFTLDRSVTDKYLFIAGGIGITPIRAMLGEISPEKEATLLYSAKTMEDLIFKDDIEKYGKDKNLKYNFYVTGEETEYDSERIDIEVIEEKVSDYKERDIYICGPSPMVGSLNQQLLNNGLDKEQIHFEIFTLV